MLKTVFTWEIKFTVFLRDQSCDFPRVYVFSLLIPKYMYVYRYINRDLKKELNENRDLAKNMFLHLTINKLYFTSLFFLTSLLEYNCFTKVCQFLLYNIVNQLYIHIYPHISSLLRLPPTLPIPPL